MRSFLVVLVAALGVCYTVAQCPPAVVLKPCSCDGDTLPYVHCENIHEMETLVSVFQKSGDRKFSWFALINSTVSYLPSTAISSKGFDHLVLSNVTMSAFFDTLPPEGNRIYKIVLEKVRFQRGIGWGLFSTLKHLLYFEAISTEIKALDKSFTDSINRDIQYIVLKKTKTRKIQHNAFAELKSLRKLTIIDSEIKSIQRSMFANSSILGELDLSGNKIETLPDNIFSNMPDLTIVQLTSNKLTTVSAAVFRGVHDRSGWIYVHANPIVCDCKILWFVTAGKGQVVGSCAAPEDMKGKKLYELKKSDFRYC